jgi:hypothetical protein
MRNSSGLKIGCSQIAGDNRTYHTLSVPDNMISESLLVLIVPKPASRRSAFCNLWRLWNREKVSAGPPGISYDCTPLVSAIGPLCISVMVLTDGWMVGLTGLPALYAIVMFA